MNLIANLDENDIKIIILLKIEAQYSFRH
ncbi:uncharacterized protein METZ01_LOCUS186104, partial [marine metagenome]